MSPRLLVSLWAIDRKLLVFQCFCDHQAICMPQNLVILFTSAGPATQEGFSLAYLVT